MALAFGALCIVSQGASKRTVAITFDDLPYVAKQVSGVALAEEATAANQRILNVLQKHHVPVTAFVIEAHIDEIGRSAGTEILRQWVADGLDLGNHTYAHDDFDQLSIPEFQDEIAKGEATFAPLMRKAGKQPQFFRFPMNHTGDTRGKHDEVANFLAQHGYQLATCTMENSDYLFNSAYVHATTRGDAATAQKTRTEYLEYTNAEIDYYAKLNAQVLGYEPPEVMLLHDNRLNSEVTENILTMFETRGYRFVTLAEAQSDPAYSIPDTYITKYGPMWGYRWAAERGVKVNGRLEPEVPKWVEDASEGR